MPRAGRRAQLVETAREQVAALVGAEPRNVIFTSGGTEANVLALTPALGDGPDGVRAAGCWSRRSSIRRSARRPVSSDRVEELCR